MKNGLPLTIVFAKDNDYIRFNNLCQTPKVSTNTKKIYCPNRTYFIIKKMQVLKCQKDEKISYTLALNTLQIRIVLLFNERKINVCLKMEITYYSNKQNKYLL